MDRKYDSDTTYIHPDEELMGKFWQFGEDSPLLLDSGSTLFPFQIAYQTYGTLNDKCSNAILICHALTGDQHVANTHPLTGKAGWWRLMIGPGLAIDTNRFFVICTNVIGGCMGSTGPSSIRSDTNLPWGLDFPVVTIADMVRAQAMLIDALGIETLLGVIGGSMGGMQALQWAASYPKRIHSAVVIASGARHSSQNIAFHEVGRQAIMADPEWHQGRYLEKNARPRKGLSVARMAAHITYMSDDSLHRKFGRNLQDRDALSFGFDADFQIESYLRHQGMTFVDRFDANSYLYVTKAMDYFDLAEDFGGNLANAFLGATARFAVISFSSDWLFPTQESRAVVHALNAGAARVSFVEIQSRWGHDSFLLNEPDLFEAVGGFLDSVAHSHNSHDTDKAKFKEGEE